MHNDRLISDEEFPLLASFMLVDMTIAPFVGPARPMQNYDWDRPAPNASLFDYDDGVPKQCTIDAGEYAAKGIDDLQHQCSSLHEIESNRELRAGDR